MKSITLEIRCGACLIQVRGKRSTKGWDILRTGPGEEKLLGHHKRKPAAIRFAADACEPGAAATFLVRPAP